MIRSQSDRIAAIVRQLLEFSRRREPVFQPIDLLALLDNVKYLLAHQLQEKDIRVEMEGLGALPKISADPELLQQVFINLYSNSLHALGLGGVIKIAAEITDRGLLSFASSRSVAANLIPKITVPGSPPSISGACLIHFHH